MSSSGRGVDSYSRRQWQTLRKWGSDERLCVGVAGPRVPGGTPFSGSDLFSLSVRFCSSDEILRAAKKGYWAIGANGIASERPLAEYLSE